MPNVGVIPAAAGGNQGHSARTCRQKRLKESFSFIVKHIDNADMLRTLTEPGLGLLGDGPLALDYIRSRCRTAITGSSSVTEGVEWARESIRASKTSRCSRAGDECCFFPKVVLFFPIRIQVHSYACVCIHMHSIVFCMHSDALHSTNRLHSNAFCNHFELLHSSDARRLHSDAFSYLLHSRHVTF